MDLREHLKGSIKGNQGQTRANQGDQGRSHLREHLKMVRSSGAKAAGGLRQTSLGRALGFVGAEAVTLTAALPHSPEDELAIRQRRRSFAPISRTACG